MSDHNYQLWHSDIRTQSDVAIQQLRVDIDILRVVKQKLQAYIQEQGLRSSGYDIEKNKSQGYETVTRLLMLAGESDIVDHGKLRGLVSRDLIGSVIEPRIEEIEGEIRQLQNNIDVWTERSIAWSPPNFLFWAITGFRLPLYNLYPGRIDTANEDIRLLEIERDYLIEKRNEYIRIADASESFYTNGEELRESAARGLYYIDRAIRGYPNIQVATGLLNNWHSRALDKADEAEIRLIKEHLGLTRRQIRRMEDYGYSASEIWGIWSGLTTDTDREFFVNLMRGTPESFAEAFATLPSDLSLEMAMILAIYAERLFYPPDSEGNFIARETFFHFNNAILNAADGYCPFELRTLRELYLEKLYAGSFFLTQMSALSLGTFGGTEAEFEQHNLRHALTGMWLSQAVEIPHLEEIRPISEFNFNNGNIRVTVGESSNTIVLGSQIMWDYGDKSDFRGLADLIKVNDAVDNFWRDFMEDIASGAPLVAVSIAFPKAAPFVGAGRIILGNGSSISGTSSLVGGGGVAEATGKAGAKAGEFIFNTLLNSLQGRNDLLAAQAGTQKRSFMDYFGVGIGVGQVSSLTDNPRGELASIGLFDPERVRLGLEWQENGLIGLLGLREEEADLLRTNFEGFVESYSAPGADVASLKIYEDALLLIQGGFPIFDDEHCTTRFYHAINRINSHLRDSGEIYPEILRDNIHNIWQGVLQ